MPKRRALILDTDPRICRLIGRIVEGFGIASLLIDKSSSFKVKYKQFKPDIIFLDMDLEKPQVSAIELLQYLVNKNSTAEIILMACMDQSEMAVEDRDGRSFELNIIGRLTKPISVDDIKTKLAEILKQSVLEQRKSTTSERNMLVEYSDLYFWLTAESIIT
jgi:DNA-binding NtrC family response regulator